MKRIYNRFRVGLMTFALGLAAVYMTDRLPMFSGEVPVDLPTAVSTDVFPTFIANARFLTREQNCGKDPTDAQARLDCTDERLFGNRNMSLYARYDIVCDPSGSDRQTMCGPNDEKMQRSVIRRHWKEKTPAHMVVHYVGETWISKSHYFIEPSGNGPWRLTASREGFRSFFINGERTPVTLIQPHWSYKQARWKIATRAYGPYDPAPGTRYLQFENETGDTVSF